jgi:hypothetical protein
MAEEEGMTLTWEDEAKGSNPPSRALYEHLAFGDYKPMLREDGRHFLITRMRTTPRRQGADHPRCGTYSGIRGGASSSTEL